jgi:hypothetical protein
MNDLVDASTSVDYSAYAAHVSAFSGDHILGPQNLLNILVYFGNSPELLVSHTTSACLLYNSKIMLAASILAKFDCTIYSVRSGHFASTIQAHSMPFNIILACNPFANGDCFFKEVCAHPTILSSAPALFDHIRGSGITASISGYLIHSHCYTGTESMSQFREVQANIVVPLPLIWPLWIVVAFVHPDHDGRAVSLQFVQCLQSNGWVMLDTLIVFSVYGDSVEGEFWLIVDIHSNTEEICKPLELETPPLQAPHPIARILWAPLN